MSRGHALRLNSRVKRSLQQLDRAGSRGLALVIADDPCLLEAWGLAEFYTDDTRLYSQRVRLTASGRRIVATVINPLR